MTSEDYEKIIEELKAEFAKYKHDADLRAELVKAKEAMECAKLHIEYINRPRRRRTNRRQR